MILYYDQIIEGKFLISIYFLSQGLNVAHTTFESDAAGTSLQPFLPLTP